MGIPSFCVTEARQSHVSTELNISYTSQITYIPFLTYITSRFHSPKLSFLPAPISRNLAMFDITNITRSPGHYTRHTLAPVEGGYSAQVLRLFKSDWAEISTQICHDLSIYFETYRSMKPINWVKI